MSDISTKARPDPEALRGARALIAAEKDLRDLFLEPKSADWLADNLSVRLSARWSDLGFDAAWEVALYLADEYFQTRQTPLVVTDLSTGETIARLPAEAIYTSAPVMRESGRLAQPLPRLRPDIEASLIELRHNQARELCALRQKDHQGDTAILTSAGRETVATEAFGEALRRFSEQLPKQMPITLGKGCDDRILVANGTLRMPDLASLNLRFSFRTWLTETLVQQWLNAVAALITEIAEEAHEIEPVDFWIGPPELVNWANRHINEAPTYIWGDSLVGVCGTAFAVELPVEAMPGRGVMTTVEHETWRTEGHLSIRITRLDGRILRYSAPVQPEYHAEIVR